MALPAWMHTGLVTGFVGNIRIDGLDDDRDPDAGAEGGLAIQITAEVFPQRQISVVSYPLHDATYIIEDITVSTNDEGFIVDSFGMPGIRLVSNQIEGSDPVEWQYRITVKKNGVTIADKLFSLPPNGTVDLSSVIPIVQGSPLPAWWTSLTTLKAYVDELAAGGIGGGGGGGGAVSSVNGKVGTVVLGAADVKARSDTWVPTMENVQGLAAKLETLVTAEGVANLAPKPTGNLAILATTAGGVITTVNYGQGASAGTLAQRTAGGQVATATPDQPIHAANKAYVDARSYLSGSFGAGLVQAPTRAEARAKLGLHLLAPGEPLPIGAGADSIIFQEG